MGNAERVHKQFSLNVGVAYSAMHIQFSGERDAWQTLFSLGAQVQTGGL